MPNRDHEDSYYDRPQLRAERSDDARHDRGRAFDPRGFSTQQGYAQRSFEPPRRRTRGYTREDFERANSTYAPEWRSYAQDWRDSPEQLARSSDQPRSWPRAEGYARQSTDIRHRHESVFGEREEWDRELARDREADRTRHFVPSHDQETLGQQLRHAGQVVANRVKRAFRGPRGYKRSDERIREDVNERLAHQDQFDPSDIEVRVQDGEVTLCGTVHSRWDKFAAEEMADSISGVEDVHNQLRVQRAELSIVAERTLFESPHSPLGNRNIRA